MLKPVIVKMHFTLREFKYRVRVKAKGFRYDSWSRRFSPRLNDQAIQISSIAQFRFEFACDLPLIQPSGSLTEYVELIERITPHNNLTQE